jgi:hypothetical protein
MQALAPYAFGLILERHGPRGAMSASIALSLIALGALLALRQRTSLSGRPGRKSP